MLTDLTAAEPAPPPPPITGDAALAAIHERLPQRARFAYAALHRTVADRLVSDNSTVPEWAATYLEAVREVGTEINAHAVPFFLPHVMAQVAGNIRGAHQGFAFRAPSALSRIAWCDELARSIAELEALDPAAALVVNLWRADHVLAASVHAALWSRFDPAGNEIPRPPAAVSAEAVAAIVAEAAPTLDPERRAAVAKVVAYELDRRAVYGKTPIKGVAREIAEAVLAGWSISDEPADDEPTTEPEPAPQPRKTRSTKR
ncbi:MAG: hypothetical protein IPM60_14705 [Rhodospirillales bacterium]|nr:hypothetical protein [Rhodospirillales bacterium]